MTTERPLFRLIGLALVLFVLGFVGRVEAVTIVSQTGSIGPSIGGVNGGIGLEASWTQLGSYSNVGVTAIIFSGSATAPGTDTFFLTTSLGPGTTVADQVASSTLAVPSSTPTPVQIFSGLTLGPGTYFLVLGDVFSPAIFWATSDVPTVLTNALVTFNGTGFASPNCGICPYYPAATYDTRLNLPLPLRGDGHADRSARADGASPARLRPRQSVRYCMETASENIEPLPSLGGRHG